MADKRSQCCGQNGLEQQKTDGDLIGLPVEDGFY